jgi:hypothetical protein
MKKNILLCLLYLCIFIANANANTYTLSPPFQINGGYAPGDTLLLPSGIVLNSVRWTNLHGTAEHPIVIMNTGGKVELRGGLAEGIKILNCSHLKISGNGHEGTEYGIYISYTANGLPGINIKNRSHHIEIEHVEIENTGFSGIMAKDDAANNVDTSAAYWKMEGLNFHHNYIHDLRMGEGIYIGSTQWARGSLQAGSHDIDNIRIYDNIFLNTPSEAIQVGACPDGNVEIYNNDIKNYGISPFEAYQANGIQLGNGFAGKCYNNKIIDGTSTGIIVLGIGDIYVYNNLIVRSGSLGIFSGHQTAEEGKNFYYYHNTIINPGTYAIQFRAPNNNIGYFYNNIVLTGTGKPTTIRQPAYLQYSLVMEGNYSGTINLAENLFIDASLDDYRLINTALAIDNGVAISNIGLSLSHDIIYAMRPTGDGYDIGAYEYIGDTTENQAPIAIIDSVQAIITYPQDSIRLIGSSSYDPDGIITNYTWEKKSGPGSPTFFPDSSKDSVWIKDLSYGIYVFRLTVTDDKGKTAYDDIEVVVNQPPVAVTDSNFSLTLPASSFTINGGGSYDPDSLGYLISYEWIMVSGPGASLSGTNSQILTVSDLIAGIYMFQLVVTDNHYATDTTTITVTVKGAPPIANAGGNQSIYYPANSTSLAGTGTDPDGYITSYQWQQLSGPTGHSTSGWNTSELVLSNLTPGEYTFAFTVIDNEYMQNTDSMVLQVYGLYTDEVLYRINCGGMKVSGSPIPWEKDMQIDPSSYLAFGSGNYTTGSLSWRGTNTTNAPDSLFGGHRHQPSYANPIKWSFPVDSGWYEVRLYFAVKNNSEGSAPGQRIFSVNIENERVLTNYDIYTDVQLAATVKSFITRVNDGILTIDFIRNIGNPQINAIEIVSTQYGLGAREVPALVYTGGEDLSSKPLRIFNLYPNPASGVVRFELSGNKENSLADISAELNLIDPQGRVIYASKHKHVWENEFSDHADFSEVPAGIYIARLQYAGQYYFQRVIVLKNR